MKLAILLALLLAGCQTTEERLAADAADDAQCKSYGIEPGDPAYVQCRTNLDNNHAEVEASEGATATFSAATAILRLIAA